MTASPPTPSSDAPKKKPYQAPRLEELVLKGDEMASASCKTATSATGPATDCINSACRDLGS